jgi:hypothetical protein
MLVTDRLHYGTLAKVLHWLVVALLVVQFPIGWIMPDVHGGPPGSLKAVPGTSSAYAERGIGGYYLDVTPDIPLVATYRSGGDVDLITGRINYRFNWGGGPAVARY